MALSWGAIESNRLVAWLNSTSQAVLGWKVPEAISMYRQESHLPVIAAGVAVYFTLVFGFRAFLRRSKIDLRKSVAVNRYALVHNVFMSLFSLYMFVDAVWQLHRIGGLQSFDAYMRVSSPQSFQALHDLFYWSKFIELIDTLILVAKQKELGFLHLFHHATTGSVCYVTRYHPLWMGTWTNGLVHVFMYAHFARPISFIRKYLTTMQIVQFIFVLTTYHLWSFSYARIPVVETLWPNFCYYVYLAFFCKFFYDNYIAPKPKSKLLPKKEQ